MNILKKYLCIILSIAIMFTLCGTEAAAASSPKLNKTSVIMLVGGTTTLKVTGTGSKSVTWSSSDKSVCTVSKSGKVKAKSTGNAVIYAKVGSKRLSCKVRVVKSYISSVSGKTLKKGEKVTLSLKVYNVKAIKVSSSDSKVVKVTKASLSKGKAKITVSAVSGGTAYITVRDKNNSKAYTKIKVTVKPSSSGKSKAKNKTKLVSVTALSNKKSLQRKCTDKEFQQAYDKAKKIVEPLAGKSRKDQLYGIASALRDMVDSGKIRYSTSEAHYDDPYGYFVLGVASCAGCARATGLCLNMLGIEYEHVNEGKWSHQWCRVKVGNEYWICDAYGLYVGPEPAPYEHPYL